MNWEAANAPKSVRVSHSHDSRSSSSGPSSQSKKSNETVEAALSRISKAYSTSMECIGHLGRVHIQLLKKKSCENELLTRLSKVARQILESILMDPLVAKHATTLMQELKGTHKPQHQPVLITSAAHKETIRELAYLSLVNYSDLLTSCCSCDKNSTILDRGIVPKLSVLVTANHHHWREESLLQTQHLILAALCDASNLDGSDPLLWLKLACSVTPLATATDSMPIQQCKYRRLQRYALERGSMALPPTLPPNRVVARAYQEFQRLEAHEFHQSYSSTTSVDAEKEEPESVIILELPRYSWSILGRMLLKACREGSEFQSYPPISSPSPAKKAKQKPLFGSPTLKLKLNPMFVLPPTLLGHIVNHLDRISRIQFESTCRGIAFSMIAARATTGQLSKKNYESPSQEPNNNNNNNKVPETPQAKNQIPNNTTTSETSLSMTATTNNAARENISSNNNKSQQHRTSKRLRSQLITSGKIAERLSNRKSFDYCFLAACAQSTNSQHELTLDQEPSKHETNLKLPMMQNRKERSKKQPEQRLEEARLEESSLRLFVEEYSTSSSSKASQHPMGVLFNYLKHVANHVETVVPGDPRGPLELTSCLLTCLEVYTRNATAMQQSQQLFPYFFRMSNTSFKESLELFGIDILYAELLLKQCDRHLPTHVEFDDDSNRITLMITAILEARSVLNDSVLREEHNETLEHHFVRLSIRCYWLAAGFFLWRSRSSRVISEARQAQEEGIYYIEETSKLFALSLPKKMASIPTPHLVSPGRTESHWKEISPLLLAKVGNEIQASAVVSLAKQNFQELVTTVRDSASLDLNNSQISQTNAQTMIKIGEILLDRYKSSYNAEESKHIELIQDFLTVHGEDLVKLIHSSNDEYDSSLDSILPAVGVISLPTLLQMTNPSILSILVTCLNISEIRRFDVAKLFIRLILTTIDLRGFLLERIVNAREKTGDEDNFSDDDSDDDSIMSDDHGSIHQNMVSKNADERRLRYCGHLVIFLLDRLHSLLSSNIIMTEQEKSQIFLSEDIIVMIQLSMELAADFTGRRRWSHSISLSTEDDQRLFQAIRLVVGDLINASPTKACQTRIQRFYFVELAKTIISHRPIFLSSVKVQGNRGGRAARQKLCIKRAEFLGLIFSELGYMLSLHMGCVDENLQLVESPLLQEQEGSGANLSKYERAIFLDAMLGLWKYASMALSEESARTEYSTVCSAFDRPIVKCMQIPLATAITALCGSATRTRRKSHSCGNEEKTSARSSSNDPLCLTEFFDSDASANEWLSDHEEGSAVAAVLAEKEIKARKKELLRAICHAIHCINIVVGVVQDNKGALTTFTDVTGRDALGPLLPLVATRVLNHFADKLLLNFGPVKKQKENLWVNEYPFSTQTTGDLVDSLLRKTYKWLHGFSLVGEKVHQSTGKDASTITNTSDSSSNVFQPESTSAAAQLYRCIVRAYATGRRSPPKASLEVVLSALPPLEESEKSKLLRDFMFSANNACFELVDVTKMITKEGGWNAPFATIKNRFVASSPITGSGAATDESSLLTNEIMRIRRGISTQIASGQIPTINSDSCKKSEYGQDDDRLLSTKHEEELSKKVLAIVDDLCLSDASNSSGWLRAAQCLTAKSELIADRIGLSKGFSRSEDFAIPTPRPQKKKKFDLATLERIQERQDSLLYKNWIKHIGNDLSVYVRHSWSSFSSLVGCASEISHQFEDEMDFDKGESTKSAQLIALNKFQRMHQAKDFLKWQESWGGIFVCALRNLALRFMCTALFILLSKETLEAEDRVLMAEIFEMIGVSFYTELMASQNYGYPMNVMAQKRRRDLATVSKGCFEKAVNIVEEHNSEEEDDSSENRETWDLLFMIGKCEEKIAGTYRVEHFNDTGSHRKYEQHLASAMKKYSSALTQAESIESDGGLNVGQQGGSSHGTTEVLYRALASRLKCLLLAVSHDEDELEKAEMEALRLTDIYWFKRPESVEISINVTNTRDRVWSVLTDIVAGLAQCRLDHHFFHRSVYRHAQALMWAPILCDPTSNEGSLGTVPATRSCQIRGLNNSTHAANSAEVVMSTLFEKKRSQLCAVWMTTTASSSPFQLINNSTRKYDSLRGKYIAAYIESLRLCNRRSELEQLMKWISGSKRDLPNFFQTSALAGGTAPPKSHINENLLKVDDSLQSSGFLLSSKRQLNSAFANVLMNEFSNDISISTSDLKKTADTNLKHAYACYLRLHCSEEYLRKTKAMKYGVGSIREVEVLCQAFLNTKYAQASSSQVNDWSGGARKSTIFQNALEKCKALYPSLSSNFLYKHLHNKSKDKEAATSGNKRKMPSEQKEKSKISFDVSVPENLNAGDTFLTTVRYGENLTKKVKLTVPEGNPSTLRFTLKV